MGFETSRETPEVSADSPVAFTLGRRDFTLADVLEAAECLGEWEPFRAAWMARQQAAAAAAAAGLTPAAKAVDEAVDAFRYARDLVSGEECEAWLAARDLAFSDLVECVTRRLQAELVDGEAAEEAEPIEEEAPIDGSRLRVDALLADEFGSWARHLARRAAAAAEAGADPGPEVPVRELWSAMDRAYRAAAEAVLTAEARQRELAGHRMGLMRLHLEVAEFDSEAAAREAWCCVREDGLELAAVARENGLPAQAIERFLGDLPPEWATLVQSARTGDVVLHRPDEGSWVAVAVKARREPSLDDPAVVERVDAALTERHFHDLESKYIRWRLSVEVEA